VSREAEKEALMERRHIGKIAEIGERRENCINK